MCDILKVRGVDRGMVLSAVVFKLEAETRERPHYRFNRWEAISRALTRYRNLRALIEVFCARLLVAVGSDCQTNIGTKGSFARAGNGGEMKRLM